MNADIIHSYEFAVRANSYLHHHHHPPHLLSRALSRRQFGRAALSSLAVGAALGTGLWRPTLALASPPETPVPIPGATPVLGGAFHVFGPGAFDPIDAEPSTITDFKGFVGLAYLSGEVTQTNTSTGEVRTLPFVDSDMRFMKGVFRGTDGQIHHGAFALVWIDVYEPGPGPQIHDLNPSTVHPTGLFWTREVKEDGIDVELGSNSASSEDVGGSASLEAFEVPIFDYGKVTNSLFGGGPPPVAGTVSFKVVWSGVGERVSVKNTSPVYGGFAGEFIRNSAQMEWTGTVGNLTFASAPLSNSSSSFAEIGHERNGLFFSE
jgi:hypothetical protein